MRLDDIYVSMHYEYGQRWDMPLDQVDRFLANVPRLSKSSFLLQSRFMERNHSFVLDARYVNPTLQAGLHSRLSFQRAGSTIIGLSGESTETTSVTENFTPYLTLQWTPQYRVQLSSPFRTQIDRADPQLNNATYSFNQRGRGRLFSFKISNAVSLQSLRSRLYLDGFLTDYKYGSILYDRTRTGASLSFDFPVLPFLRAVPKASVYQDSYIVKRVRILNTGGDQSGTAQTGELPRISGRSDNGKAYGCDLVLDFGKQWRSKAAFLMENVSSSIREFNSTRTTFEAGLSYAWPSSAFVARRLSRFTDSTLAEEF